jgi:DNA-binding Lrp family transcriptional regulator
MGHIDFNTVVFTKNSDELRRFIEKIKEVASDNLESIDVLRLIQDEYVFQNKVKSEKSTNITSLDKKLLSILINNARISLKELSKKLDKSYPFIVNKLKNLKKTNIIKTYYPDIDFNKIGLKEYSVYIKTKYLTNKKEQEFKKYLIKNPYVFWYVKYIGKFDYGVEILSPKLSVMRDEIGKIFENFPDLITETKSVRYLLNKK